MEQRKQYKEACLTWLSHGERVDRDRSMLWCVGETEPGRPRAWREAAIEMLFVN